jgi:glycogen operon protein
MIFVAQNMYWDALPFELPGLPPEKGWHVSTNTGMPSPEDIHPPGAEPRLADQKAFLVGGRSVVILVGR